MDNDLFAIDVDADDYADAAESDPAVSRTFQSEENYQAQKAAYSAKVDDGNQYAELLKAVPTLTKDGKSDEKVRLSKKDIQLLGYATGEMYWDKKYPEILDLCCRVENRCVVDEKLGESLRRWKEKCGNRLETGKYP